MQFRIFIVANSLTLQSYPLMDFTLLSRVPPAYDISEKVASEVSLTSFWYDVMVAMFATL